MDSLLFSDYIDLALLVVATIAIFDGVRQLTIYGPGKRSYWTLFSCAVLVFSGAMIFQFKYLSEIRPSRPAPVPARSVIAYPGGAEAAPSTAQERAEKSFAQFAYLERGEIITYTDSTGAKVRFVPSARDAQERAGTVADRGRRDVVARAYRVKANVWWLFWIPVALAAYLLGRRELSGLVERHQFSRFSKPQTYAEVEGFVGLLKAACEDPAINSTLEVILSQSDTGRKKMIEELLTRFRDKRAPQLLIDAFVCLMDDEVAEKVYVFIHKCERPLAIAA